MPTLRYVFLNAKGVILPQTKKRLKYLSYNLVILYQKNDTKIGFLLKRFF